MARRPHIKTVFMTVMLASLTLALIMYTYLSSSDRSGGFISSQPARWYKIVPRRNPDSDPDAPSFILRHKSHHEHKNGKDSNQEVSNGHSQLGFNYVPSGHEEGGEKVSDDREPGQRQDQLLLSKIEIPDRKENELFSDSEYELKRNNKLNVKGEKVEVKLIPSGRLGHDDDAKQLFRNSIQSIMNENDLLDDHDKGSNGRNSNQSKKRKDQDSGIDTNIIGMIQSPEDKKVKDEGFKKHAFNVLISDRIGNTRSIPDTRHPLCKNSSANSYNRNLQNSSVSIIICFYNEAFSALLRTIHSIMDRTPDRILKEILLVDDFSNDLDMKYKFMRHVMEKLPEKVKYLRTPERAGLIRARMFGANHATGHILVFLDSHVEVNVGWLPPLVNRIAINSTTVVTPVIDIIDSNTFQYSASPIVKGGFNWGLHFKWDSVPRSMLAAKSDFIKPIPSPTMAGGLFAMSRDYFFKLGGYDKGMDIWGGENLEMSFRVWMCGGSLEIIPCSRVGHVFRGRRPYGSPSGEDTLTKNSLRVANVWMDDYKKYYLQTRPDAANIPYGDVTERQDLRKRLKCQSFDWYVKNVYPELKPPLKKDSERRRVKMKGSRVDRKPAHVIGRYQLQVSGTDLCVESENEVTAKGSRVMLNKCIAIKRQLWSETEKSELRLADILCLDSDNSTPILGKCHELGSTQEWKHSSNKYTPIYNEAAGLCLGVTKVEVGQTLTMSICSSSEARKWNLISRVPIFP